MTTPQVICAYCNGTGSWEGFTCDDCGGAGTVRRTVWFMVADLNNPAAEPYAVLRADVSKHRDSGVEATVESLHWSRDVAEQVAEQLNQVFGKEAHHA